MAKPLDTPAEDRNVCGTPAEATTPVEPSASQPNAAGLDTASANSSPRTPRRAGRRSVAPETLARATTALKSDQDKVGCKLVPTRGARGGRKQATQAQVVHEEEEEEEETSANEDEDEDANTDADNLGLDNPTPQMLAQKRKSLSATSSRTKRGTVPTKSSTVTTTTNGTSSSDGGFTGVRLEGESAKRCKVYLVNGDPAAAVEPGVLKNLVPNFAGANLTMVHTPADWQPPEIFNAVKAVRGINKEAGLDSFLVLVSVFLT